MRIKLSEQVKASIRDEVENSVYLAVPRRSHLIESRVRFEPAYLSANGNALTIDNDEMGPRRWFRSGYMTPSYSTAERAQRAAKYGLYRKRLKEAKEQSQREILNAGGIAYIDPSVVQTNMAAVEAFLGGAAS